MTTRARWMKYFLFWGNFILGSYFAGKTMDFWPEWKMILPAVAVIFLVVNMDNIRRKHWGF